MLDKSALCATAWILACIALLAGCATPEPQVAPQAPPAPAPAVAAPAAPARDEAAAQAEEARALLAQAETDVQRARARRALWSKAWEDLVAARQAMAAKDTRAAARHARRASELAALGLEQLAYPAVR